MHAHVVKKTVMKSVAAVILTPANAMKSAFVVIVVKTQIAADNHQL